MELEKLKQKGIDAIDFIKKIDKDTEDTFIKNYKELGIDGLTESFLLDVAAFKKALSDNNNKTFCKFYYIQKGDYLNLGLSFSDNEECDIKQNKLADDDVLYILENDQLIPKDFRQMKKDFTNKIGAKLPIHPGNKKDTLISYSLQEINGFLDIMEKEYSDIYNLKFNMFKYSPVGIDHELSAHFTERKNRIAFCVHALFNKKDLYGESDGYDLGNLRP